jgi:macrodomain Ter protein organizer (MatP/YcbG family)
MSKGQKRLKNIPILHDEVKRKRTINLTDTAWNKIKLIAIEQKTSVSELIEKMIRECHGS